MHNVQACLGKDPRYYQIAVLSTLLVYGNTYLNFGQSGAYISAFLASILLAQWLGCRMVRIAFDPLSPLISGLSLCLLLRTDSIILAMAAAWICVIGKFLIRWRGKHVFNPSNLALVVMLTLSDHAWLSPGQWGAVTLFAFMLAAAGTFILYRSDRLDIVLAFVGAYAAIALLRAYYLGDPLAIPIHQLQSGALILFAFFMITDPKTTPDAPVGRVLFAIGVAGLGAYIQYFYYHPIGFIWALALSSPLVPLFDYLFPAKPFVWQSQRSSL